MKTRKAISKRQLQKYLEKSDLQPTRVEPKELLSQN